MMTEAWKKYFDPVTLNELRDVTLSHSLLRHQGPRTGTHRGTGFGQAIEFAEHQPYVPGDDLRKIDWRLYARTDRFFLQNREDETTLVCHLLLDSSGSMSFRGIDDSISKFQYAAQVAAAFAYITVSGQDLFSLVTDSGNVDIPLGGGDPHLYTLGDAIDQTQPSGNLPISQMIGQTLVQRQPPGIVVILSDLFDDFEAILQAVEQLKFAGHDPIVVQILSKDEVSLPYQGTTHFLGLEGETAMDLSPGSLQQSYEQVVQRFLDRLGSGCIARGASFLPLTMDMPVGSSVARFLSHHTQRTVQ